MTKLPKGKILISILFTIIAFLYALPNFTKVTTSFLPQNKVNLGLDLRGGAHLLLDVDFDGYLAGTMETITDSLRKSLREEKIGYKNLATKKSIVQLELRSLEDFNKVKKIIKKIDSGIAIDNNNTLLKLSYTEARLAALRDKVIEQSIEIVRMRVDSTGTKEPMINRQGDKYILLQVPGEENPVQLRNILGQTAKLTFHLVDESANIQDAVNGRIPSDGMLLKGNNEHPGAYYVVVKKKALISGDQLTGAQASFNQNSQPVVHFSFDSLGGKIFAEVTKNNKGKRLAIVLDNKLLSAAVINEPIIGGSGIISGNFTVESAAELSLLLRAGALPTPLRIIEERSIGPNLGTDSISSGIKAGIIGLISVVIFMVWSYGILGVFANIALILALLYIMALLSIFQATLTLPGIAGIILTIGMAVDANVLIYERIKEELKKGASNLHSIRLGFDSAFGTILDSNITTLIAALFLYIFGVGAIKGFAVTLTIGIVSSMFASVIITKLLIDIWIKYYRPKHLGLL